MLPFQVRDQVAKRYLIAGIIATCMAIALSFISRYGDFREEIRIFLRSMFWACVVMLFNLGSVRSRFLKKGNASDPASIDHFAACLREGVEQWRRNEKGRLIFGAIVLLTLIFLISFEVQDRYTVTIASLFIALLLYSIMKSWMYFLDQIAIHDLEREDPHHDTDIST